MNSDLMRQVADAIESEPEHFRMDTWCSESACGTTYCVAGWAVAIDQPEVMAECQPPLVAYYTALFGGDSLAGLTGPATDAGDRISTTAQGVLGITDVEASALFHGGRDQSAQDAALKLRKFADAGEVDEDLWYRREL